MNLIKSGKERRGTGRVCLGRIDCISDNHIGIRKNQWAASTPMTMLRTYFNSSVEVPGDKEDVGEKGNEPVPINPKGEGQDERSIHQTIHMLQIV